MDLVKQKENWEKDQWWTRKIYSEEETCKNKSKIIIQGQEGNARVEAKGVNRSLACEEEFGVPLESQKSPYYT